MPQLTIEQKNNLKKWAKSLKIRLILVMAWLFIIMPIAFLFFRNSIIWLISEWIFIILFGSSLYVRHYKKCPNCKARIGGDLPNECHKCGVSFK